jgi:hypothetical protein
MLASTRLAATCKVLGSRLPPRAISSSALLMVIASMMACGDPVRDREIEALGPEAPGVPPGPLHRPGQPCVLCHSEAGVAEPFLFAGTVYIDAHSLTPIDDVRVDFIDSVGSAFSTVTNCAGSFIVRRREYSAGGPIWVSMQRDEVLREMETPIYRDGSCAGCHDDPLGPASAGHVFLIDDPEVEKAPLSRCR